MNYYKIHKSAIVVLRFSRRHHLVFLLCFERINDSSIKWCASHPKLMCVNDKKINRTSVLEFKSWWSFGSFWVSFCSNNNGFLSDGSNSFPIVLSLRTQIDIHDFFILTFHSSCCSFPLRQGLAFSNFLTKCFTISLLTASALGSWI